MLRTEILGINAQRLIEDFSLIKYESLPDWISSQSSQISFSKIIFLTLDVSIRRNDVLREVGFQQTERFEWKSHR